MGRRQRRLIAAVVITVGLLLVVGANAMPPIQVTPRVTWVPQLPTKMPTPSLPNAPTIPTDGAGGDAPPAMLSERATTTIRGIFIGLLITLAAVIIAGFVWRFWPRRSERHGSAAPPPTLANLADEFGAAARQARSYLRLHRESGDMAKAITVAWQALETVAEEAGHGRRSTDTAAEFTASLVAQVTGSDDEIIELLELYHRARFGDPATTGALSGADVGRADVLLTALVAQVDAATTSSKRGGQP